MSATPRFEKTEDGRVCLVTTEYSYFLEDTTNVDNYLSEETAERLFVELAAVLNRTPCAPSGKDNCGFNYVDITTKGCDGWLNLFFGDQIIAMISDQRIAEEIRAKIKKR